MLLESVLGFHSLLRRLVLFIGNRKGSLCGWPPTERAGERQTEVRSSGINHVGQPGRRSPFSVFLEQLNERHRLTAFQLGIASQRVA